MFKSTEIKKAWQIRKSSAANFGVNVMVIRWAECLRLAKMGEAQSLEEQVKNHKAVESFNEFKTANGIDRVYLNLAGRSRKGDMACKIYFDRKSQQVVFQNGKGYRSGDFQESLDAIDASFNLIEKK